MPGCLINGEALEVLSVQDRGLQYGDGLFETLAVRDGAPCHWPRHLRRLQRGCERLGLPAPDSRLLEAEAAQLCHGVSNGVLKIILTRGPGQRGYISPELVEPTRVLRVSTLPEYPATHRTDGVVVTVCQTPLGLNPALAGIKHLNRLEQVLARAEWRDPAISEGLMLDLEGHVIEGTMSNLFVLHNGELVTPDLARSGVAGITRERIMELAIAQGLPLEVRPLTLDDVTHSDEFFICNSLIGIWPVKQLQQRNWHPGPVTRQLMQALEQQRD